MAEGFVHALLKRLRTRKFTELDKIELDLVKRPYERREFAGDPNQADIFRVKTRNKGGKGRG